MHFRSSTSKQCLKDSYIEWWEWYKGQALDLNQQGWNLSTLPGISCLTLLQFSDLFHSGLAFRFLLVWLSYYQQCWKIFFKRQELKLMSRAGKIVQRNWRLHIACRMSRWNIGLLLHGPMSLTDCHTSNIELVWPINQRLMLLSDILRSEPGGWRNSTLMAHLS